jgi:uncharacterized protein YeaO (DUF488 family)
MTVSVVRLGSKRTRGEGLRIGTVRRPPRGVPKHRFAVDDWYDVWLPVLAPSARTVALGLAAKSAKQWSVFVRRYRSEMARDEPRRTLDLLAALSRRANFSVGCYCEDEARCHRGALRALVAERGAKLRR